MSYGRLGVIAILVVALCGPLFGSPMGDARALPALGRYHEPEPRPHHKPSHHPRHPTNNRYHKHKVPKH
jgi:hypothetical protein